MFSIKKYISYVFILLVSSCSTKKNALQIALASENPKIKTVMNNPEPHEIQIIYTEILRDKEGKVSFKDFSYNLNSKNYFYPASTVKFPIAVLALEKLNTIPNTDLNTTYTIEGSAEKLQFSEEITKVFAVSDNVASTNLLDFLGFDYVNLKLKEKGLYPFILSHRLSGTDATNPEFPAITLYKSDNTLVNIPSKRNQIPEVLSLNGIQKGNAYRDSKNKLINEPFDFSKKNYYPLETLHNTLKRIVFPEVFKKEERFIISEKDRQFILYSMQNLPKNAGFDPNEFFDGYCKFLCLVIQKKIFLPQ
ncbi:class A beta-lactamase-related serine hydrolase [Flavobacterium sp. GP15]|uniref:class A beta-lactamase-related serine hydrolase n=1 Tax=Flavobacterium sp. GP15 TaxID=2758567 RepID=UPI0021041982|nr:class A beta-lactamase-related serine hydrolase [Flavobacterium sp. GP15]